MENIENRQDDEVLVLEVSSEDEARSQAAAHWGLPEDEILLKVVEEEIQEPEDVRDLPVFIFLSLFIH